MNRYLSIAVLACISCSTGLFAQKNEVIVRVSHLFVFNATELVETEDVNLITAPIESDNNSNISLDINYLRQIKKLKWAIRIGFDQSLSKGKTTIVRTDTYSNSQINSENRSFRIGIGLYQSAFTSINNKANLGFSLFGNYGNRYENKYNYSNELFDVNDNYIGGSTKEFDFSNSWRVSIDLGAAFYYYFFPKMGIGMEINLAVYYEKLKGLTTQRQVIFDANRIQVEEINSKHHENKTTIGKVNPFSIALAYKF